MNCKPGDLAVCVRHTDKVPVSPLGRLCTVLFIAPSGDFRLPDGYRQLNKAARGKTDVPEWVVEWHTEMAYPLERGGLRWTRYGVCPDRALRPVRDPGDDARDETLNWLPVPQKEVA